MSRHLAASLLPLLGLASCSLINAYDDVGGAGGSTTSSSTSQGGGATTSSSSQGGGPSSSSSGQGGGGGSSSSQGGGGSTGSGGAGGGEPTLPLHCQFVSQSQRLAGSTQNLTTNKRVDELYPLRIGTKVRVVSVRRAAGTASVDQYDVPDDNQQGTISQTNAFARDAIFHIGRVGDAIGIAVREGGGERIELQRWLDGDGVNTFASSIIADPGSGSVINARFESLTDHNDIDVFWERSTGANTFSAQFNHYDGTLETAENLIIGMGNGTTVASRFPGPVVRAGSDVVAFLGLPTMSSTASSNGFRFQVASPPGTGTAMQPSATAMVSLGKPVAGEHPWAALVGFANEIQLRVGATPSADVDDIDTSTGAVAHSFTIGAPVERFRAEIFGTVLVLAGYVSGEPAVLVADADSDTPLLALHFDILDRTPPQGYGQGFGVRPRPGFGATGGLLDVAWSEENADGDSDTIWVGAIDCREP